MNLAPGLPTCYFIAVRAGLVGFHQNYTITMLYCQYLYVPIIDIYFMLILERSYNLIIHWLLPIYYSRFYVLLRLEVRSLQPHHFFSKHRSWWWMNETITLLGRRCKSTQNPRSTRRKKTMNYKRCILVLLQHESGLRNSVWTWTHTLYPDCFRLSLPLVPIPTAWYWMLAEAAIPMAIWQGQPRNDQFVCRKKCYNNHC